MTNKYFRFIINGFVFLILVWILDAGFGKIFEYYYFKQKSGDDFQTTYVLDSLKTDILILGSSRASHHYIPDMIEKYSGLRCFNAGRDGHYLMYNYVIFKSYIQRYQPKIILFDISMEEFGKEEDVFHGYNSLYPYYTTNMVIQKEVDASRLFMPILMQLQLYKYNSLLFSLLKGLNNNNESQLKGFKPLYGSSLDSNAKAPAKDEDYSITQDYLLAIADMASEAEKRGIKLMFIKSPRFVSYSNKKATAEIARYIENNRAVFIDLASIPFFIKNPLLFKDGAHLNKEGAEIFTKILIDKLKNNNYTGLFKDVKLENRN